MLVQERLRSLVREGRRQTHLKLKELAKPRDSVEPLAFPPSAGHIVMRLEDDGW